MFSNHFSMIPWVNLGQIGSKWQLLRFDESAPPTWERYWAEQREYWGADDKNKARVQHYFGETNTEENLLADSKKKYDEFREYLFHWNGLCKVGEKVQVVPIEPNVIALSKNWKGQVSDHSDLEVWLKEETALFFKHVRYCCEIYSFGTITVLPGSIEAGMGERVGSSRVSHRKGKFPDRNETVELHSNDQTVTVGDAVFRIVG